MQPPAPLAEGHPGADGGRGRRRPSATVVVPAWNAWEHTERCLASLRPTLGRDDRVVVVDNGSTDGTADGLAGFRWARVVGNRENLGFARACNQGAEGAEGDVLVFLNNDTAVHHGWLDELLAPFAVEEVAAAGPRSDNVSGVQHVPSVPAWSGSPDHLAGFARRWRDLHRGQTSEVARLVGFCLAVRRRCFEAVGGFDEGYGIGGFEDDDLGNRLRQRGWSLVIAHGAFVHHHGHATFAANGVDWSDLQQRNVGRYVERWGPGGLRPAARLSACLIVRDEEDLLPACLESIGDAVDEIVVYDTGSTDRTVDIARAAGAHVVEGFWDDSFARARNAALAEATGEWVLSIDADERLQADPDALRHHLDSPDPGIEAFLVAIENLHGAGNPRSVHTAIRVFRRRSCTWRHRLHEQVTAAEDPHRRLQISHLSGVRLIHHGYEAGVFEDRHKTERNLALAEAALHDDEQSRPYALMNYGRALESAGRSGEAVRCLDEAATTSEDPITQRLAVGNLVAIYGRLGRFDEALVEVDRLRRLSRSQVAADMAEGRTRIAMGDTAAGLALLARVPARARDDDGMEYAPHMVAAIRGEALASLERYGEASDVVLDAVRTDGVLEADMGELSRWLLAAGRSPAEITAALSEDDLVPMLGRVIRQRPGLADVLLDGAFRRFPDRLEPLAAAARVAGELPVARALVWSSRLRSKGLADACPLVAIVSRETADPVVRVRAAAAAYGAFGEARVAEPARRALAALHGASREACLAEVSHLAPDLSALLTGAASPPPVAAVAPVAPVAAVAPVAPVAAVAPVAPVAPEVVEPPPAAASPAAASPAARPGRRRGPASVASHPVSGGLNLIAPFEGTSLEAGVARQLAGALYADGVPVATTSYHWDGDVTVGWDHRGRSDLPFQVNVVVIPPDHLVDFVLDAGTAPFVGRYMIGLWLWDLETPSPAMADAGRMVHEVFVPTPTTAAAIRSVRSGPVRVVPLPAGPPPLVDRAGLGLPDGLLFVATVDYDRGFACQNPLGAVDAFCAAFAPGEGPVLAIDAIHAGRFPGEHGALLDATAGRPDIVVRDEAGRTPQDTDTLVAVADAYVSLHRADASLARVRQAMAWGVPTVVTATEPVEDLQGSRDGFHVDTHRAPAPPGTRGCPEGAVWNEPHRASAIEALRAVAGDRAAAAEVGRRAAWRAGRRFSDDTVAQAFHRRVRQIDDRLAGSAPPPPAGDLGEERILLPESGAAPR